MVGPNETVIATLMTPQVLAILGTVYTGERRARAFAAYGMTMGLAAGLVQLLPRPAAS